MVMSAPKTEAFFPFFPDYMSWEDWNGNFIIYYGQEPIGMSSEDDWKIIASQITQLQTFSAYPISDPANYENWQDWAKDLSVTINGPSR